MPNTYTSIGAATSGGGTLAKTVLQMVDCIAGMMATTVTAGMRLIALARLNEGYARVLRGAYPDPSQQMPAHIWTCLRPWATLAIVAGTTDYTLPADFNGIEDVPIHPLVTGVDMPEWRRVTPEEVARQLRDDVTADEPYLFAISPITFTAATGQRWEISVFPTPANARTVKYRYTIEAATLTDAAVYPVGGNILNAAVLQAGLAAWELRSTGGTGGAQETLYRAMFLEAVAADDATGGDDDEESMADADTGMEA